MKQPNAALLSVFFFSLLLPGYTSHIGPFHIVPFGLATAIGSAPRGSQPAVTEIKLQLADYLAAMSGGKGLGDSNISLTLPVLVLFDPKGVEVYKGETSQRIVRDLQDLQDKLTTLKPIGSAVKLADLLASMRSAGLDVKSMAVPYDGYTLVLVRSDAANSAPEAQAEAALNGFLQKAGARKIRALELKILGIT